MPEPADVAIRGRSVSWTRMLGERRSGVDCSHPHNREWPGTGGPEAEDERTHNRGTHQGGVKII